MEQRKRMLGTLACLVVSMTGTAALLGWIDPSRSALAVPLTAGEVSDGVLDGVDFRPEQWTGVDVILCRRSGATWNDPTDDLPASHLYVDEAGRISRDELWSLQAPASRHFKSIVIVVCLGRLESTLNAAHQATLVSLFGEMDAAIQTAGADPLPIRYLSF